MKFCTQCGNKLKPEYTVCPKCGKSIQRKNEDENLIKEKNINNNPESKIEDSKIKENTNYESKTEDSKTKENINHQSKTEDSKVKENNKSEVKSNIEKLNSIKQKNYVKDNNIEKGYTNKNADFNKKDIVNTSNSKGVKIAIFSIMAIIVCIVAFQIIGRKVIYNPHKMVSTFQEAVSQKDISKLKSTIKSDDPRLDINDENVQVLCDYFKDNPSYLNEIVRILNNEIQNKDFSNSANEIIYLKENGSILGVKKYCIVVKPIFADIHIGIKDVKVKMNKKDLFTSTSDDFSKEVGPFMPGNYKIEYSYSNKYTDLKGNQKVNLAEERNGYKKNIDLQLNIRYIDIYADSQDNNDAIVYINNKSTNIPIKDAKHFGPVDNKTIIHAAKKVGKQVLKSDAFTVGEDSVVYLNITDKIYQYDNLGTDLALLMRYYTAAFVEAVNYDKFDLITPYVYEGSNLYNEQKKFVNQFYKDGVEEECIQCELLDFTHNEAKTEGTLRTRETYNITQKGKTEKKTFENTYNYKLDTSTNSYKLTDIK